MRLAATRSERAAGHGAGAERGTVHRAELGHYLFDTTPMDRDLPPEIFALIKTSPWAFVACFYFRQLLRFPFATILAIRLARSDEERATFLADRHPECRPARPRTRNRAKRKEVP